MNDEFDVDSAFELTEDEMKRDEELTYLLSKEVGRRFLWRIIDRVCGIHASTFSSDKVIHAYAQGRRDVGVELRNAVLSFSKEKYIQMEVENL